MPARPGLIVALLTATLGACHLPGAGGAEWVAAADGDEAEGLGCWQDTCQRLSPARGPLAFEVIPRASGGLEPVAFAPAAVDRVELRICPPTAVTGQVELPSGFPLEIEATATTAVPGLSRRRTFAFPAEPGASGRRPFSLALPPATWRLRFTSRDGASPPLAATVEVPGCTQIAALNVSPPGLYSRDLPLRFGPGPVGRCGATVQALDATTGEPRSARVESSGDGDRCPERVLRLHVHEVDEVLDLLLRVRPTGGGAVPSRDLRVRSHPGAGGICAPDEEPPCDAVATIDLLPPDGDGPTHLASVTVAVEDEAGLPVAAVERVSAAGLLDGVPTVCDATDPERCGWGGAGGPAIFTAREDGPGPLVNLPLLLPGRYRFTVVPAAGPFAITALDEAPVATGEPVRLRLARKETAAGTVSFEGRPLRSLVRAEPVGHEGRPAWTETGDDGRYELALDPGPYRLEVQPRDRYRSVPWASLELPADFATAPHDVKIPARARVRGRAVGGAVGGAVVRAFRCLPDCTSPGAVALPVGETIADDDGSFALLVPGS